MDTEQRRRFMEALAESDAPLTEWEARFVESFVNRPDRVFPRFTTAQCRVIDGLAKKYAGRIAPPQERKPQLPPITEGCDYLVRGERGLERCGRKATYTNSFGDKWCDVHAEIRARVRAPRRMR
jgi:hypothetical protein